MYDAIVVGARCAGSSAALRLAQKGHRVLLVDKKSFPSDTLSTLFIQPSATAWLEKWGVTRALVERGTPALERILWDYGSIRIEGVAYNPEGVTTTYAPRRTVLDALVVEQAVRAGAELRERFTFEDVVREGDAVVGVRGTTESGASVTERAKIVIGADGMRSSVAKAVGAEMTHHKPTSTCTYYAFFGGMKPRAKLEVLARDGLGVALVPTNDALLVVVTQRIDRFEAMKHDVESGFMRALEPLPELASEVRDGKREERIFGTGDLPIFLRRAHGPGWALVGDAGYMKDPVLATGISDAIVYAVKLADKVSDGLSGRAPMSEALAAFEAARDAEALPMMEWVHRVAQLRGPSAKLQFLLEAISRSPSDVPRFLGVNAGTVSPVEFFAPENVEKIFARAVG